jgi:hypothetical protein
MRGVNNPASRTVHPDVPIDVPEGPRALQAGLHLLAHKPGGLGSG